MTKFDWAFDAENYLSNKNPHGCKIKISAFVKNIGQQLDAYKKEDWDTVRKKPHHHSCNDLGRKKSKEAKRLNKHLETINLEAGEKESTQIEPFQIAIKGYPSKREYRIFGYVKHHRFHLVYLDPDHTVYKE